MFLVLAIIYSFNHYSFLFIFHSSICSFMKLFIYLSVRFVSKSFHIFLFSIQIFSSNFVYPSRKSFIHSSTNLLFMQTVKFSWNVNFIYSSNSNPSVLYCLSKMFALEREFTKPISQFLISTKLFRTSLDFVAFHDRFAKRVYVIRT